MKKIKLFFTLINIIGCDEEDDWKLGLIAIEAGTYSLANEIFIG